jgi:hypothetical protein
VLVEGLRGVGVAVERLADPRPALERLVWPLEHGRLRPAVDPLVAVAVVERVRVGVEAIEDRALVLQPLQPRLDVRHRPILTGVLAAAVHLSAAETVTGAPAAVSAQPS